MSLREQIIGLLRRMGRPMSTRDVTKTLGSGGKQASGWEHVSDTIDTLNGLRKQGIVQKSEGGWRVAGNVAESWPRQVEAVPLLPGRNAEVQTATEQQNGDDTLVSPEYPILPRPFIGRSSIVSASLLAKLRTRNLPLDTTGLGVLNLGSRASRKLLSSGYLTVQQLVDCTEEDLLTIRQLGPGLLHEITAKLHGYLSRMLDMPDWDPQVGLPPGTPKDPAYTTHSVVSASLLAQLIPYCVQDDT